MTARFTGVVVAFALLVGLGEAGATELLEAGEEVAGWTVTDVEHHREFRRYFFWRPDGMRTGVEIVSDTQPAGEWRTGRHRLMPAPGEAPPVELLVAVLRRLETYDNASAPPLAQARQRVRRHAPSDPMGYQYVPDISRGRHTGVRATLLLVHYMIVLGFLWSCLRWSPATDRGVDRIAAFIAEHPLPFLLAILAAMLAARIPFLDRPFAFDAESQRLFFASLDIPDILAHRYQDERHPQLSYLLAHPFVALSHAEAVARLPAALASLAAAAGTYALARLRLSVVPALAAAAIVGASLPLLEHSCQVSDVPLFTALVAWSTYAVVRALDRPGIPIAIVVALLELAMVYTYYLAPVVAACHLAVALLHGRSRAHLPLWIAAGGAAVAAIPALTDLLTVVRADRAARATADMFPEHLWGQETASSLVPQVVPLLAPAGTVLIVLAAVVLGIARLHRRPWRDPAAIALPLIVVACVAVLASVATDVRLKPYYALFCLPAVAVLAAAGCFGRAAAAGTGWRRAVREGAGLALFAALLLPQLQEQSTFATARLVPPDGAIYHELGERLRAHRDPPTVIADPENLHTILVYYLLDDPTAMYRTCAEHPPAAIRCGDESRQLFFLTSLVRMDDDWMRRSVDALRQLQREPTWVVYSMLFPNELLRTELRAACTLDTTFGPRGKLELYACPAR